jgi:type II secretory pathway component PulF
MESTPRRVSVREVVCVLVGHCALWFAVTYWLIYQVPIHKRMYENFGMPLPQLTTLLLDISDFAVDFGWLLIPALLGALIVEAAILVLLWKSCRRRVWGWLWAILLAMPQAVLLALTIYALYVPMAGLREKLSAP